MVQYDCKTDAGLRAALAATKGAELAAGYHDLPVDVRRHALSFLVCVSPDHARRSVEAAVARHDADARQRLAVLKGDASTVGTVQKDLPAVKIKLYNENSDRYRADHGKEGDDGYAVALNIKALELKKLPRKKMLAGMRKVLA